MTKRNRRFCKTLCLKNDPQLIEEYCHHHASGNTWPEINQGMRDVGILDMEIYLSGNQLFMIMETTPDFDHDRDMDRLADLPRQKEWETFMTKFQDVDPGEPAAGKWQVMERIYSLREQE